MSVEIQFVKLEDIDADAEWNSRSASSILPSLSETDDESTGLDGLIANIREHGQDTPVDIRPTSPPFYKLTDRKYSLVAGFRRHTVFTRVNSDKELRASLIPGKTLIPGIPDGHIRCAIHPPMTEQQAFLLNGRENANREQIGPPDVFRLIRKASEEYKMSPTEISVWLGKSYPSVLSYVKMQKLPDVVLKHWSIGGEFDGINSSKRIGIHDMFEIAKRKPEEQEAAYKKALVLQARKADTSAWWEKAKSRAVAMGARLAKLQRGGFLIVSAPSWMTSIDVIAGSGKRELKFNEARELATLAEASFKRELEKPVTVTTLDSDDFEDSDVSIQ